MNLRKLTGQQLFKILSLWICRYGCDACNYLQAILIVTPCVKLNWVRDAFWITGNRLSCASKSLADGIPDGGAQVINRAAVNTGNLLQGMESLGRTSHAQHLALDKRSCSAGVLLQQILDGCFRINLNHNWMIASSMALIFALAQRCEKKQGRERSIQKALQYQGCSENSTKEWGSQTMICSRLDLIQPFFSQVLRMRLTV